MNEIILHYMDDVSIAELGLEAYGYVDLDRYTIIEVIGNHSIFKYLPIEHQLRWTLISWALDTTTDVRIIDALSINDRPTIEQHIHDFEWQNAVAATHYDIVEAVRLARLL